MREQAIEWVVLAPGIAAIATVDRSWIHRYIVGSPFAKPMIGPGSVATTRNLLEAAARAGWAAARGLVEPPLTAARWAYRLCSFYQTTHATPPLMREAARRFAKDGRATLAQWAETKAREEQGHDALALRDLRALGYDAEAAVRAVVPPRAAALVSYFERLVHAEDPVGCVGYAYALERMALEVDEAYIARVEATLRPGARATRCLRVHSAEGSDRRHVAETIEVVAALPPPARARIAVACYETAALCCAPREGEPHAEEALQRQLLLLERERSIRS
jgi:hypothetical protein